MRLFLTIPFVLSACSFDGAKGQDTGPGEEPEVDAAPVDAPPPPCVPGFLDLCAQSDPTNDLIVTNIQLDTDRDTRCETLTQANGPDVCLLHFNNIEVQTGGTFLAFGSRPLALVARTSLKIVGVLDVSSVRARPSQLGAGSAPTLAGFCGFTTPPQSSNGGGAGGAGGTFISLGGVGGIGNTDQGGRNGGTPGPIQLAPAVLRGGCHGQAGGAGTAAPGGPGGFGGGAVYLSAASLQISGVIYAGGGGAGTAGREDGGGGGGSGGMIVAQSPALDVSNGTLLAGGGGGGGGADAAVDGAVGGDATSATAAAGGNPNSNGGGGGGAGSIAAAAPGSAGNPDNGGGGGGGGGAGFILLLGAQRTLTNATIVPMAIERAK